MMFAKSLSKTAVNLSDQALNESNADISVHVPGTDARENAETGQAKSTVKRTMDTEKTFSAKLRKNFPNEKYKA